MSGCTTLELSLVDRTWHRIQTDQFTVVGDTTPDELQQLVRDLDYFRDFLIEQGIARWRDEVAPLTIVVVQDDTTFDAFRSRPAIEGWYRSSLRGSFAVVNLDAFKRFEAGRSILFHEYTHFLLAHNAGFRYPRWYGEGLAEYFSTFRMIDDAVAIIGEPPVPRLRELVHQPLDLRLLMKKSERLNHGIRISYAHAWLAVHYFSAASPSRQQQLTGYLSAYSQSGTLADAYLASFGETTDDLYNEMVAYRRAGTFRVRRYQYEAVRRSSDYDVSILSPYQSAVLFGQLFLAREEFHKAGNLFEKANRFAPDAAVPLAGLAAVSYDSETSGTRTHDYTRQALQADAENAWALTLQGKLLREVAEAAPEVEDRDSILQRSREVLNQAIQLAPRIPEAYRELALTYDDTQRRPYWLLRAGMLEPLSEHILLDIARFEIDAGHYANARRKLEQVIFRHDSDARRTARGLLNSISEAVDAVAVP
ncbi:MAG: hypothetical protein O2780_08180 [Proteobacteria bacterium]|nr:hypothetical protein [Pseudomonadota bacterium]MDA1300225.1 hypothetical protein [Pseudomonadota bacterium]